MKIRMLFEGNFEIEPDHPIHLQAGETMDVSEATAARLIEGLCAEAMDNISDEIDIEQPKPQRKVRGKVKVGAE